MDGVGGGYGGGGWGATSVFLGLAGLNLTS